MQRCKKCKHRTFDTADRCPTCGVHSTKWYARVTGQALVVALAVAVLIFIVLRAAEPSIEPFSLGE